MRIEHTNESLEVEGAADGKPRRFMLTKPCSVTFKDESQKYKLPDQYIRNRVSSKYIDFMNPNEIYESAKKN